MEHSSLKHPDKGQKTWNNDQKKKQNKKNANNQKQQHLTEN